MPSRQYKWEQVMLTLAAIAYRGFELVQLDPHKSTLMYEAMAGCLRELGPVKDQWDIVWGLTAACPRLSRDLKDNRESGRVPIWSHFAEFLSAP
jgi:hypothetical protein